MMPARLLLGLLGLLNLGNGLLMLAAPHRWYESVPGVAATGPFNHHFVVDIALAYLASGAGMAAGFKTGRGLAAFALAGALWPALHALFHIAGWLSDGFPTDAPNAAAQVVGVVFIGFVGLGLALWRAQQEGADHVQSLSAQEDRGDGARIRL
ncbi:MAG TPA: hypothetical protein VKV96_00410 [Roseiarcus sp.]|nr:hypothetical protein [Roseiarcus sp.]